jgi:hypothetical protein
MRFLILFLAVAAFGIAQSARSQSPQSQSGCIADRYGNVLCGPAGSHCLKDLYGEIRCSPTDGGIALDRYKTPVCGPGKCVFDRYGDVVCSSVPKGAATLNLAGDPVCTEGCVRASAAQCVTPTR